MDDDLNKCIDRCNQECTHYDVSVIVHKVLKNMYKYHGDGKWKYYDISDNIWKNDMRNHKLRYDIKTVISDLFVVRSMYWFDQVISTDINQEVYAKFMSEKLMKIASKLKDDKFISIVIKEARSFFDIHSDD